MKKIFFIVLLMINYCQTYGQNYLISTYNGQTLNTCSGNMYDSGGGGGNYDLNEDFSMTIHSNSLGNTHSRLFFQDFNIDPTDTLFIYDGPSLSSPLIGAYNNFNSLFGLSVLATASNLAGSLTIRFKSENTTNSSGWEAQISCFMPCQQIIAGINPALFNPPPSLGGFVDICPGDTVTFAGSALFPQNDLFYHQGISSSVFLWSFGDGSTDTGLIVHHHYQSGGIFYVQLIIYDSLGCYSTNSIQVIIQQSCPPVIFLDSIPILHTWNTYILTAGPDSGNTVFFIPCHNVVPSPANHLDTAMFIPDGGGIGGQCYQTSLLVNQFNAGQIVQDSLDVLAITVNMEHSFMGDLEIFIICPNGQQAILKEYIHQGGTFLGIPMGGDSHHNFDGNPITDPAVNPPGEGWNYSWTMTNPQYATMQTYGTTGNTTPLPPGISFPVIDSGSYTPFQPFSSLIGCPLNGVWTFRVCDYWAADNGWIFKWGIEFDSTLLPVDSAFTFAIDSIYWNGPFITQDFGDSIQITPTQPGAYQYILFLTDALGCTYDTVLTIMVEGTQGIPDPTSNNIDNPINIYPNPTNDWIKIHFIDNIPTGGSFLIYDVFGRLVLSTPFTETSSSQMINLTFVPNGIFLLKYMDEAGKISLTQRFIVIKN